MSNKMPNASHAKTVSAHSLKIFLGGIVLLLFAVISNPVARQNIACMNYHTPHDKTVSINGQKILVNTVATEAKREQGLSGRPCIKDNQAMLFVFDAVDNSEHCFWMKDMRFAIDMVWLDQNKQVVYVVKGAQPASYPKNFCPGVPTGYVLELKNGQTTKLKLRLGDKLSF